MKTKTMLACTEYVNKFSYRKWISRQYAIGFQLLNTYSALQSRNFLYYLTLHIILEKIHRTGTWMFLLIAFLVEYNPCFALNRIGFLVLRSN